MQDREMTIKIIARVLQGSVLGPILWNILYNGTIRTNLGERTKITGFANDLAIFVRGGDQGQLKNRVKLALRHITSWLTSQMPELAPENTEV